MMNTPLCRYRQLLILLTMLSSVLFSCSLLPSTAPQPDDPALAVTVVDETDTVTRLDAQATLPSVSSDQTDEGHSTENGRTPAADNMMSGNNSTNGGNGMAGGNMIAGSNDAVDTTVSPSGQLGNGGPDRELGSSSADQAIAIAAAHQEMAWHVSHYRWDAEAWQEDGDSTWWIDFWSVDSAGEYDEWLAWAGVDLASGEVVEAYVPRELTAEEFQYGRTLAEQAAFNDAAVLAIVQDLNNWDFDTYYDRWDENFYIYMWYGIDEIAIIVRENEDGIFYVDGVQDASVLEAEQQEALNRNQAIELAWESDEIWDVLQNHDQWKTYVEHQGGTQYSVAFVTENRELFYAIVDIASWQIVDSGS